MTNQDKQEIDAILIIANKIKYRQTQANPGVTNWQAVAEVINRKYSYPLPPDPELYDGANALNHFATLLNRSEHTNQWAVTPVHSTDVQEGMVVYDLAV